MKKPNIKEKFKKLREWLKKEVLTKDMLVALIIAELIFWSPCIVLGILALIIDAKIWAIFGALVGFWALPITPAIPCQIALAFLLKKLFKKRKKRNEKENSI